MNERKAYTPFISFSYIITEALKHFLDHVEPAFEVGHQLLWHSCFHILMHESHIPMHVYIFFDRAWDYQVWIVICEMKMYYVNKKVYVAGFTYSSSTGR